MAAVPDQRLRVCGIRELRVVDALRMPSAPTSNIKGPVIIIWEKAADMILEEARMRRSTNHLAVDNASISLDLRRAAASVVNRF
jgi:choline dehydrogenase